MRIDARVVVRLACSRRFRYTHRAVSRESGLIEHNTGRFACTHTHVRARGLYVRPACFDNPVTPFLFRDHFARSALFSFGAVSSMRDCVFSEPFGSTLEIFKAGVLAAALLSTLRYVERYPPLSLQVLSALELGNPLIPTFEII